MNPPSFIHSSHAPQIGDTRTAPLFTLLMGVLLLQVLPGSTLFERLGLGAWLQSHTHWTGLLLWCVLGTVLPLAAMLTVRRVFEARFWLQLVLLALLLVAPTMWAAWSTSGTTIRQEPVLLPFFCAMAIVVMIVLPYFQTALRHGQWRIHYPDLFEYAWFNALALLLTITFVGICLGVLYLWAVLFRNLGIGWFWDHLLQRPGLEWVLGVAVGLGMLISRRLVQPVQALRQIVFALCTVLLPVLAALFVLLAVVLVPMGPGVLWATGHGSLILLCLLGLMSLMVNAVYQDGMRPSPYKRPIRWLLYGALILQPLFAALALYSLWLRIDQYGLTQMRIVGLAAAGLMGVHALGQAAAALFRGRGRLDLMRPVNVLASILAVILLLLLHSPVLDLHRMTAESQLAQLEKGRITTDEFDIGHLRWASGMQGYQALQQLQQRVQAGDPAYTEYAQLGKKLESALAVEQVSRFFGRGKSHPAPEPDRIGSIDELKRHLAVAPGGLPVDESWWPWMLESQSFLMRACRLPQSDCVLISRDLDWHPDGKAEALLCSLTPIGTAKRFACEAHTRQELAGQPARWKRIERIELETPDGNFARTREALRDGTIRLLEPRWAQIELDGARRIPESDVP